MALIQTDDSIVEIRNRFGGVYFKKGPDGQHVQAMPRHVKYQQSEIQFGGTSGFSSATWLWGLALLGWFASLWAAYALLYWFTKEEREPKRISGYNWYIYYAMQFPEAERPPFWKPPHEPGDLPDYIVTFKGYWTYEHSPPDHPAESPFGYYWRKGEWLGKDYYGTDDFEWFVWWNGSKYVLSPSVDFEPPGLTFYSTGTNIIDYYNNPVTHSWAHVYIGKPAE